MSDSTGPGFPAGSPQPERATTSGPAPQEGPAAVPHYDQRPHHAHAHPAAAPSDESYTALITSFIVCFAAAAIGSAFIISNLSPWYSGLIKPSFALPTWVLWPIQIMLYAMMAVSVWLVWKEPAPRSAKFPALFLFGVQLLFCIAWPATFFGMQSPGVGLIAAAFLFAAILATALSFYRIKRTASLLLWPYLLWIAYAVVLSIAIWWLN